MKFEERKQPGRRGNKGPMPFSGIHLSQLTAARWVRALRGKLCCWCEPCLWKMPRFQWLLSAWSFSSWMEFCSYSAPQRRRSNLRISVARDPAELCVKRHQFIFLTKKMRYCSHSRTHSHSDTRCCILAPYLTVALPWVQSGDAPEKHTKCRHTDPWNPHEEDT